MNVVRTETTFQPPRKRYGARRRQQFNIPLTKHHLELNMEKKRETNKRSISSNCSKSSKYRSTGHGRGIPMSSSLLTSTSKNRVSRSGTKTTTRPGSSLLESVAGGTILAITTGRGDARSEVGIAALDIRCPHLILCQISDSQTYTNTLSKIHLFDPIEVLMPDTMCESDVSKNVLYRSVLNSFAEIEVTAISRVHFNDTIGLERVKSLCNAEYSSVELFIKQKYYALAAAAALLKYVEYMQRIVYTPRSMKIEFQGSPNATTIDLESARSLELVQSQCGQRNLSLLGILDRCLTPMGRKLLRANILQPPCEKHIIFERQAAVAELVSNPSLRALIQPIIRRLYGADRLLALSVTPVLHENSVQCAEQNLNYILLLKNLLDVVPELARLLLTGESDLFREIQKKLENTEFRQMREKILETIHPDARSVTGYTSSNMQRCFAIRAGINDLLDIARQTYCELIDDMKTMVESLASKYKLTLCLNCNASLGYHIQAILPRNLNAANFDPPSEFTEVRKNKRIFTMTTNTLATLSQQCKIACEELHLMSNVLLCDLLQNIREYIGCLFQLSADVAELDLIISLAQVSSLQSHVKPTFGSKLELCDSRHPIMDVFGLEGPIPNNINASIPRNLCIISGPNMSGKSTYLKQIVLLHIMAQLGCFVPARKAMFRITDLIFCKIAVRDDIECHASTFALEMIEVQYILRSVTPTSLIVLDELCKGTAIEEGASIAWAVCEKLLNTTAFIFSATHFSYLTKLADLYCNVINKHFETINVRVSETDACHQRLTYTHRLKVGVAPTDDYGIVLAELSDLPKPVTEKARKYASEQVVVDRVSTETNDYDKTYYNILVRLYELLETDKFHREQVTSLVQRFVTLCKGKDNKENRNDDKKTTKENVIGTQKNNENERSGEAMLETVIRSKRAFDGTEQNICETAIRTNIDPNEILAVSTHTSHTNVSTDTFQAQSGTLHFRNNTIDLKRNEYYMPSNNCSFSLDDSSSFFSVATEDISDKCDEILSTLDNLNCSFSKILEKSPNSTCSVIDETLLSSFTHKSLSVQTSTSTIEKSTSKLYEYYITDKNFEPADDISNASIFTDTRSANTLNIYKKSESCK